MDEANGLGDPNHSIAIIGMAGRFPGARTIDQFWRNLRDGIGSITFFSELELAASGIGTSALDDPSYVRAGAVLDDIELFDAEFFYFSPREAEILDPQHRLFLECAWEALEDAGYDPQAYEGSIGVYASAGMNTYLLNNIRSRPDFMKGAGAYQVMLGNDKDFMPTRVSYKLGLRGPSINVQTACSSSLVAIHLACQSLVNSECDIALAGGVSVSAPHKVGYFYEEGMILSRDGYCRAFDAEASGTIKGNGAGVVVLKRLSDALIDRDCIHAVIKGSAVNNDGSQKVGYTAPSVTGQAQVIAEALAIAEVEPETIGYIEAHGTATLMGDPIEIAGLTQAFGGTASGKDSCAIGSVKTNIGHLDTAAGVAGLIKAVLALKHRLIPPSLHFQRPNPKIDFARSPFYVNTGLSEWGRTSAPRRAGVSSFGIGGTNAHVVLEESPSVEPSGQSRPFHLLTLSAKTDPALKVLTSNLLDHLKNKPEINLADVGYTLSTGRRHFNHRRTLLCRDHADAITALEAKDARRVSDNFLEAENRSVAFMFPGQGSQYVGMARGLYEQEPIFRETVRLCSDFLKPIIGADLCDVIYPDGDQDVRGELINQTFITQPALFVIEYALARLWMHWGVLPQAMIGHSIGEYVAACLAGVLSLEDALRLIAARGRLMQSLPRGSMLAVPLPEQQVRPLLEKQLSIAANNSPSLCVVSGPSETVAAFETRLIEQEINCHRIKTSHAFHSEMIEPILGEYARQLENVKLNPPKIQYLSNVTGKWIRPEEATSPQYWLRHMRESVRFTDGLTELLKTPGWLLLEIGPGQTLSTLAKLHLDSNARRAVQNFIWTATHGGPSSRV